MTETTVKMRDHIFISHATPEDNDFTRWLGAKLVLHGYTVWFDLERLKGGDVFWPKIEKAIRERSFRMLAVVSTVAVAKSGVQDEWALGAIVERDIPGFVIPIRIDSYDFGKLPISILRKNVLDFNGGWHKGLAALLDTLADAAAPRRSPDPVGARQWLSEEKPGAIVLRQSPEILESSWLPILSLPPSVESARILTSTRKIPVTQENQRLPWFEYGDRIFGFAKSSELVKLMKETVPLKEGGGIATDTFISEGQGLGEYKVAPADARFRVVSLIRQSWELAMVRVGLKRYALAGGHLIHYIPNDHVPGGRVAYVDADGKTKRRGLNGRSDKRKVNWHYAVGIRPILETPWRLELKASIVFTGDDGQPVDPARAQRLRMSFCRNWWNDRWRGFLRAFLVLISEGEPEIALPVGEGRAVVIGASPLTFQSPVSLSDTPSAVEDEPSLDQGEDALEWNDMADDEEEEGAE